MRIANCELRIGSGRYTPWAGLLFLCAFAFYVATMAPGLMPGDTSDMVIAASSLREAHPPGYPLYALVGKLFTALPIGDIPYRANLMAAFLGGLSVALVFLTLLLLTRHPLASLAGSLLFAFNTLFWTYFTLAETFCLNNFTLALTVFLALLWRERHRSLPSLNPQPAIRNPPFAFLIPHSSFRNPKSEIRNSVASRQLLVLLAFTAGLSMGNHHTMVLTYPGLFLFVAAVDRGALRPGRLAALAGWFAFGLVLVYAYLPIAALVQHDHHWEDSGTLKGLLRLFLRAKYGTFQLDTRGEAGVTAMGQAATYLAHLAGQLLWIGVPLGVAGIAAAWRRDRAFLLYSAGAFALGVLFLMRANIDPGRTAFDAAILQRFYMLPGFFFLLWTGVGLAAVAQHLPRGGGAALLVLPALLLVASAPKASPRDNQVYPRFLGNVLDTLPPNAVFLAETDEVAFGADYLLTVERRRPDVAFLLTGLLGSEPYMTTVRRRYPHLAWPEGTDRSPPGLTRFLAANIPRHRVFTDDRPRDLGLPSLRHGLLWEVRAPGEPRTRAAWVRENEGLWRGYDLRQVETQRYLPDSMCYAIVIYSYLFQRFHLAREYNDLGFTAEALGHLRACAEMDGRGILARSPDWHREMARAYLGQRTPGPALSHLEEARALAPGDARIEALLSEARRQQQ